jgi:prevent-host-death family protein
MRAVGIRELKNRLSEFIRLVEAGESVLVTDRGTVVAELRPAGSTTIREEATQLEALVRTGRATAAAPHEPDLYVTRPRALDECGSVADLLAAERADR